MQNIFNLPSFPPQKGVLTMDEDHLTALECALIKEQTKERKAEIKKILRRNDHTILKATGKVFGWLAGATALFFGADGGRQLLCQRACVYTL